MTTLAILLSTAKVNLVSARHEGEATELLALLKRTLAAESTTVYEVCDAVFDIIIGAADSFFSIHQSTDLIPHSLFIPIHNTPGGL